MKLRLTALCLAAFMLVFVPTLFAQEPQTQTNEELITERCALAQNYLDTIQKPRDLRTRVDRLQAYLYIYQRFDMFTARLERNTQPGAAQMRTTLNSLNRNIEAFKNNYESYDEAREAVVAEKDCRNNINEFQSKLQTARARRQAVHDTVVRIEKIFEPTITGQLDTLYTELLEPSQTNGSNE